uniref:Uncharacterized protein n=1 Tax=Anguilla anguilla TaxID=7936 RepID=A0A0E9TQR4_ANGAN
MHRHVAEVLLLDNFPLMHTINTQRVQE